MSGSRDSPLIHSMNGLTDPVKTANYIFFAQFSTLLSVKSTSKGWIFCIFAAETNAKRQIDDENQSISSFTIKRAYSR